MACIAELSVINLHKQLFTVKMTVIATCFSFIQTIFMLFTVTQRENMKTIRSVATVMRLILYIRKVYIST